MKYTRLSETVEVKRISENGAKGVFSIEGLFTGFGVTVGNALRRALLSSLPGAAITQVRIKGIEHEFSSLPGMLEDMIQFALNLKKVRFHFFADEPQTLTLKVKGEQEVRAENIKSTVAVKVINPDLYLATLTKKQADLDIELVVEKGLGYVPADKRRLERLPIGTIVLDAVFSPIANVSFKVENMRVGERTDYNRVVFEIETDGSITPSEAFHKTNNVLRDHFAKLSELDTVKTEGGQESEAESGETEDKKEKKKKAKESK